MSIPSSPDRGRSPRHKRRRSRSAVSDGLDSPNGRSAHAQTNYAYEDDELQSDTDHVFHTPDEGADDEAPSKRARIERPTRLNYAAHLTLRGHKRGVATVKFSPDGKYIASGSADCTIKIWDATTGSLIHTLEGHLSGISTLAWSPDSKVLASGSDDKIIRLWDIPTGKCLPVPLVGHHNYIYSLAFSPKGNVLVSGSYDEAVFLWDVRTARIMRSLPAHSDPVSGVDFVRDGTLVASCSSDGLIRIWDATTGQCLKTLVHEDNARVTSVRFSPNGRYVLAATLDSCVRLWNYVEGRVVKTYQGHENREYSINATFGTYGVLDDHVDSPMERDEDDDDERSRVWAFAACGSEDGTVVLWDVSSKEILQTFGNHDGVVLGVDVNSRDQSIVTCGVDRTIRVWQRRPLPAEVDEASPKGVEDDDGTRNAT